MSTKSRNRPVNFIDNLEGNNHIVLLYENQNYADLIIARYFQNGFDKGESCIFFTFDNPELIKKRLASQGMDVQYYIRKNSLRIFPVDRSDEKKVDTLATLRQIRSEAVKGMMPPYRFAGRTITDTETHKGMILGMEIEKSGHEHFSEFDNSQLCFYDLSKIESSKKERWISELLKNHHFVIYASSPEKEVAFATDLLEEDQ